MYTFNSNNNNNDDDDNHNKNLMNNNILNLYVLYEIIVYLFGYIF